MSPESRKSKSKSDETITKLDESIDDPITRKLKDLYDDAANEPLPDHLMRLLAKLEETEGKR